MYSTWKRSKHAGKIFTDTGLLIILLYWESGKSICRRSKAITHTVTLSRYVFWHFALCARWNPKWLRPFFYTYIYIQHLPNAVQSYLRPIAQAQKYAVQCTPIDRNVRGVFPAVYRKIQHVVATAELISCGKRSFTEHHTLVGHYPYIGNKS